MILLGNSPPPVIYADPPWKQSKGGKKAKRPNSSGGKLEYPVISLQLIMAHLVDARDMAEESHCLFLWTIDKYLWEAERIATEIGYKLHARMIWNKVTGIPASFDVRFGHEYLLWFYRGKLLPVAKDERGKIHSVFTEQVKRHSQKPEIAYQIIERWYPKLPKLELYARQKRQTLMETWDAWGNEVESDINLTPPEPHKEL